MANVVFCPPIRSASWPYYSHSYLGDNATGQLYSRLAREHSVLVWARDGRQLSSWVPAGPTTFISPHIDAALKEVFQVTQLLIAFDRQAIDIAKQHGVPCLWLIGEEEEATLAQKMNIPFFVIRDKESFFSCQPIIEQLIHSSEVVSDSRGWLQDLRSLPFSVATICSEDYFPSFLGLIENLKQVEEVCPDIYLLALDEETDRLAQRYCSKFPLTVYHLKNLWNETERQIISSRSVEIQAYSSKARLLSKAIMVAQKPVFYLDTDLFFFDRISKLVPELRDAHVLLFPHFNDHIFNYRLHGLYNAGMLGVTSGARPFLDWWSALCLGNCIKKDSAGYFVDQGYLDLAPLYFPGIKACQEFGHNVGSWSVQTWKRTGCQIKSFHAADPDPFGFFEEKILWDSAVVYSRGLVTPERYQNFYFSVLQQQGRWWPEVGQILSTYHFLSDRLHLGRFPLPPIVVDVLMSRLGKVFRRPIACSYRLLRLGYRLIKKVMMMEKGATSDLDWPVLQVKLLKQLEHKGRYQGIDG